MTFPAREENLFKDNSQLLKKRIQKTLGAWNLVQLDDGLEAITMRVYTSYLRWKPEEVHVLIAKIRQELSNPRIHKMYNL